MKIPFFSTILDKLTAQEQKLNDLLLATQAFRLLMEAIVKLDSHQQDMRISVDNLKDSVKILEEKVDKLKTIGVDISRLEQKVVNSAQYEKIENELTTVEKVKAMQQIPDDFTLPLSDGMRIQVEGEQGSSPIRIVPYQVSER